MTTLVEAAPTASVLTGSKRLAVLRIVAGLLAAWFGWGYRDLHLPPAELWFFPPFADLHLPVTQTLITVAAVSAMVGGVAVRKEPVRGSVKWATTGFCVVLGLIYFGAGWAKLTGAGVNWGTQFVTMVDVINGQKGLAGAPDWLVNNSWLGTAMGTGALAFELFFLPLLVWPKTRRYVWPVGVIFHLATWWLMGIGFLTLVVFYLVFLPWREGADREPTKLQTRVTIGLVTLISVFALSGIEAGWPFASYPSFEGPFTGEQVHVYADGVPIYEAGGNHAHAVNAIINGRAEEYAAWLGVGEVELVVIDQP